MTFLTRKINKLRKISLYLFFIPTLALIISLLLHNILVNFHFQSNEDNYKYNLPIVIECNKENNFCGKIKYEKTSKFDQCEKYIVKEYILINNNKLSYIYYVDEYFNEGVFDQYKFSDLNVKMHIYRTDKFRDNCILNSNLLTIYKILPKLFVFIEKIRSNKKYQPPTHQSINPFIYGETSISNVVKRYPINIIFKPLLYLSSLLMIAYWLNYNKIFKEITENQKIKKFAIFGIASSILLFLHIIFLGTTIDNEIFNKIRKLILVLFILCEIIAQFLLTRRLYLSIRKIESYIFKAVLNLKIIFVSILVIISIVILSILAVYSFTSKIDYILEWNYFLFLLFFYLLSSIMWKKN